VAVVKNSKNVVEVDPMPVIYKNCYGDEFFLHETKTKTGRPMYYFSKKAGDKLAETIPSGYEIFERPGGLVYIRKEQPVLILEEELEYVQNKIAGMVDHESEEQVAMARKQFGNYLSGSRLAAFNRYNVWRFEAEAQKDEIIIHQVRDNKAMPIMKFELRNKEDRLFSAYRWCFRGSVDDWRSIAQPLHKPFDGRPEIAVIVFVRRDVLAG
jgi:hypothetical protein